MQSSFLRGFEIPQEYLNEWTEVMHEINYLAGFENDFRYRAERIALDIQISNGKTVILK